ncbi:extracellular solute-binding protein [Desertihabitans aurantiacus]|uniref:extracellular solute-binding protein n=1 Tax=Desertihabitans aurantiacus TaxID=2282477 RepID=UPI000DF85E88|nr:extracellular solute-binding protein [Desertihabitans aurantiacus]
MSTIRANRIDRRLFLGLAGGTAVGAGLAACSGGGTPAPVSPSGAALDPSVLPKYIPQSIVEPDIKGVNGSVSGFTTIPREMVQTVPEVPGRGSEFTAMTPLWATVPPGREDNAYMQAVDAEIGARFQFNITDGNSYNERLQAVLASPRNVPDFVTVQSSGMPTRFDDAVRANFQDLTPFLAGDAIERYPNLAALPTAMWSCCVFNGGLYALPYASDTITTTIFQRRDLMEELGIEVAPSSAEDFLSLLKELTGGGRWAVNDLSDGSAVHTIFGTPPLWVERDGTLVHRYETDEYRAAMEYQARVFAAGVVHPDSVAGNSQQGRQRFISGEVAITGDGVGGWLSTLRAARPGNPDFDMYPVPLFAADGTGEPVVWKGTPANLFSFLKKSEDPARIEEQLALANYFAAPFGSRENVLLDYGVEGTHHERDERGAFYLTDQGEREVVRTYTWISRAERAATEVQYDGYVEDMTSWMASVMEYAVEPPFYGRTLVVPNEFASLSGPFEDLEADIARGRRTMADLDAAVEDWRRSGGDRMRAFYLEALEAQG